MVSYLHIELDGVPLEVLLDSQTDTGRHQVVGNPVQAQTRWHTQREVAHHEGEVFKDSLIDHGEEKQHG